MRQRTVLSITLAVLIAGVAAVLVIINRPSTRTVSSQPIVLAPFVGTWGQHEVGLVIESTGTGHFDYSNFKLCPKCSFADAPRSTVDFMLTSVSDGVALGSVTGTDAKPPSDEQSYTKGELVTVKLVVGTPKGKFLQITIGSTRLSNFCNSTSIGECGS